VLGRGLADRRDQRQAEEVTQAEADVARERLPRLGLQVDGVLVLEQRERLGIVTVSARPFDEPPLAAHPLEPRPAMNGSIGSSWPSAKRVQRHLDRVVKRLARPTSGATRAA